MPKEKLQDSFKNCLNFVGFNLKIDGIFGINTEKAVKKFQNNRNLKVDGIVGKKTWSYLIKGIKV